MCLAVPALVREKKGENLAEVDVLGVTRTISLDLVQGAEVGDWVLMHAGFAIEKVDEDFANETLELIRALPYLSEDTNIFGETPTELVVPTVEIESLKVESPDAGGTFKPASSEQE